MVKATKAMGVRWSEGLDEAEVRAAYDEATVGAYGDHEKHTGLLTALADELRFPFKGKVLGEVVQVVGLKWPEGDEFGLDLLCEKNGKRHRVEARSVELLKPLPKGHLTLAAYMDWRRRLS